MMDHNADGLRFYMLTLDFTIRSFLFLIQPLVTFFSGHKFALQIALYDKTHVRAAI